MRARVRSWARHRLTPAAVALGLSLVAGTATATTTGLVSNRASADARGGPGVTAAGPATPDPADPSPASSPASSPSPSPSATVAPLRHLVEADLLVAAHRTLDRRQVARVAALDGVKHVTTIDLGGAWVDGHRATIAGVDPSTFRAWTPKLTAESDPLWHSVSRGEVTASFDMGHDANLPLGQRVRVASRHAYPLRLGAFASMGLPTVDAVVSRARAAQLGLTRAGGLVVSAPGTDLTALRQQVLDLLPAGSDVQLLRRVIVIRDAGEFLDRQQINAVLKAAYSQLGKPYQWGAIGPDSYDCSGLVGWAFAQAGVLMPRTAAQQFLAGPHVPLADARPGDLLFWTYDPTAPDFVDHVAIYVGDGKMVVAPHTGDVVRVGYVPTANLAGVVRVDPAMARGVGGPRFVADNGLLLVS